MGLCGCDEVESVAMVGLGSLYEVFRSREEGVIRSYCRHAIHVQHASLQSETWTTRTRGKSNSYSKYTDGRFPFANCAFKRVLPQAHQRSHASGFQLWRSTQSLIRRLLELMLPFRDNCAF